MSLDAERQVKTAIRSIAPFTSDGIITGGRAPILDTRHWDDSGSVHTKQNAPFGEFEFPSYGLTRPVPGSWAVSCAYQASLSSEAAPV